MQALLDQERAAAAAMSDRDLQRGFKTAATHFAEAAALFDFGRASYCLDYIDVVLDEWNGRRR